MRRIIRTNWPGARGGGGGTTRPVGPVTNFYAVAGREEIELTWTDPDDLKTTTGEIVAEWAGTRIVRNTEHYPQSVSDGVLVLDSTVRNQYATTPYVDDGLENGVTYYYRAFTRTTDGAENWDDAGGASAKPMAGQPLSNLPVGARVNFLVDNVSRDFIAVHRGRPSGLYDTSFAGGTILLMKDAYENRQWHSSNVNDCANSTIHSHLNDAFLNLIEERIRARIRQVKIPYRPGSGTSKTVNSGTNGLPASVWLLSGYEMNWTSATNQYFPADGATLSYFAGTATADAKRIAYLNGEAVRWWLRSPITDSAACAWRVGATGSYGSGGYCSDLHAVRPALGRV